MANYRLRQTGQEVQDLLDKVEGIAIEDGTITVGEESITPVTEETDPTVPAWAKEPTKPNYSLAELQDDTTHRTVSDAEKATWNSKQNAIADLDDIRSGAGAGATAVQPSQMQTALAGKQDTLVSGTNIKTVNGEDILGSGNIVAGDPNAVKYTEQTLTDAQKTQARTNIGAGTYSKPSGGIPGSDIADGVIPDVSQFITKSVNDLANYYLKSETYTKDEVAALIGAIQQFHYEIVATLPASGAGNILYLLGPTGTGADKYEEYVYANSTWTKIGDTSIDLSGYVTTTALNTALANYWPKADVVNITLSDLAISGDWADIENNPIPEPSAADNGKVLGVTDAQGTLGWVQGGGGGSGSVTSVGLSVPTGLQVSGSPITSSGTLAVSYASGYSIPTDAKQSGWDAKYEKPSTGIPEADLASAVTAKLNKEEIFWAEYDVTTFADIYAAYQAGKYVVVKDGSLFYTPYLIDNGSALFVDIEDDGYCYFYRVSSDGWELALEYHIPNDGMWEVWSGKYDKPSGGIPETDLASAVQTSLGKADTALQSFTETDPIFLASPAHGITSSDITNWNGKQSAIADLADIRSGAAAGATAYQKPSGGIPESDLASAVQTSLGKADTALQSFTETDPTVPAWAKASTKPSYTASEVGALPDTTVIPDQLSDLSDDATHRLVTDTEKTNWNAKYSKPSGGIPASDLASGVIPTIESLTTAEIDTIWNNAS